jgi:RNA polymerase sigma-70 factor (ECF subfamily)
LTRAASPPLGSGAARDSGFGLVERAAAASGPRAGTEPREVRLARMLKSYYRDVWCLVRRLGVRAEAADDAAQQVFWVAADKLAVIEVGREKRFLLGTALRVAANARRAERTRREEQDSERIASLESTLPLADALLHRKRMRELLDTVLDSMPPDLRAAFVLFEVEGLSTPEAAELLGIPLGTVASRLRRAREVFRKIVRRMAGPVSAGRGTGGTA